MTEITLCDKLNVLSLQTGDDYQLIRVLYAHMKVLNSSCVHFEISE